MTYTVRFLPSAAKELRRLPEEARRRVGRAIDGLVEDPRPQGFKKLAGPGGIVRIRVGDYRVLYRVDDDIAVLEVLVVKIGNRRDVYRFLDAR